MVLFVFLKHELCAYLRDEIANEHTNKSIDIHYTYNLVNTNIQNRNWKHTLISSLLFFFCCCFYHHPIPSPTLISAQTDNCAVTNEIMNENNHNMYYSKSRPPPHSPSPEPHISGKGYPTISTYLGYWLPLAITKYPLFLVFSGNLETIRPKIPPPQVPEKMVTRMRPPYAFEWGTRAVTNHGRRNCQSGRYGYPTFWRKQNRESKSERELEGKNSTIIIVSHINVRSTFLSLATPQLLIRCVIWCFPSCWPLASYCCFLLPPQYSCNADAFWKVQIIILQYTDQL